MEVEKVTQTEAQGAGTAQPQDLKSTTQNNQDTNTSNTNNQTKSNDNTNKNTNNNSNNNNKNEKKRKADTIAVNTKGKPNRDKDMYGAKFNNAIKYGKNSNQKREHAQYGNYEGYYGYRLAGGAADPRTVLFTKEMFYQKRCLDIGCNSGIFTIDIAQQFEPRYIVGVDIDKTLIFKAQKNVQEAQHLKRQPATPSCAPPAPSSLPSSSSTTEKADVAMEGNANEDAERVQKEKEEAEKAKKAKEEAEKAEKEKEDKTKNAMPSTQLVRPTIDGVPYFPISLADVSNELLDLPREVLFPQNIRFKTENYVATDEVTERFDAIFCLSVSKWVHLNWGDEGIKKMFHKIYNSLYEGGVFVFEPQPRSSYKKRARLTHDINENYKNMKLKPEEFSSYLTSQVGFKTVQVLSEPAGTAKGFDRPVYIYTK